MYTLTEKECWTGRVDSETVTGMFRLHQVVRIEDVFTFNKKQDGKAIGIIGFRSDEGVRRNKGRVGAYHAPDEIRKALASLPYHFHSEIALFDFGNISCDDGNLEGAQAELGSAVKKILELDMFPLIIGGGHEVAYGHFLGVKSHVGGTGNVGIVNIDAHFDMRPYDEMTSSGTMFKQIADECAAEGRMFRYLCAGIQKSGNTKHLFEMADRHGCQYIYEDEISWQSIETTSEKVNNFIEQSSAVMVTLCSDVMDASYAPGVSAPQPFGMEPKLVARLLQEALKNKKAISFDIAEINPVLDESGRTVKLAAAMLYKVMDSVASVDREES